MLELGSRQNMTNMDIKWARLKTVQVSMKVLQYRVLIGG